MLPVREDKTNLPRAAPRGANACVTAANTKKINAKSCILYGQFVERSTMTKGQQEDQQPSLWVEAKMLGNLGKKVREGIGRKRRRRSR